MMERRNKAVFSFQISISKPDFHTFLCSTLPVWASFSESVIQEVHFSVSQSIVRKNTCWQLGSTNVDHVCAAWYAFITVTVKFFYSNTDITEIDNLN